MQIENPYRIIDRYFELRKKIFLTKFQYQQIRYCECKTRGAAPLIT